MFEPLVLDGEAWEILLEIYIQIEQGMSVSVSNAYVGSGVAPTTALRRIAEMQAAKVLLRTSDPNDRRRSLIKLSDDAIASLRRYLSLMVPA